MKKIVKERLIKPIKNLLKMIKISPNLFYSVAIIIPGGFFLLVPVIGKKLNKHLKKQNKQITD